MLKGSLPNTSLNTSSVMDVQSLQKIKTLGKSDSSEAVKAVAQQFESYFVHQMIKTMRASVDVFAEGNYLRSNTTDFHQSMLDQQWAQTLSEGQGMGLAEVLARQLQSQYREHLQPEDKVLSEDNINDQKDVDVKQAIDSRRLSYSAVKPDKHTDVGSLAGLKSVSLGSVDLESVGFEKNTFNSPQEFIERLMPLAKKAAEKLNTQADVILAQAALETGWGKSVIPQGEGSSHNLFNIKADQRWQGEKVAVTTLEFNGPSAIKVTAPFRSYDSWEQSFDDYVSFLSTQPRYQTALEKGHSPREFAQALQQAGYATDPEYAQKIERVRLRPELQQAMLSQEITTI